MNYQPKQTGLEQKITAALQRTAAGVELSARAEDALYAEIAEARAAKARGTQVKKELNNMKFSKKMIFAVCAIMCLTTATAFAGGRIVGWSGHNIVGTETDNFAAVESELAPQLEFEPVLLEEFGNGFKFASAHLGTDQGFDETHNKVGKQYIELAARYTNGQAELNLYCIDLLGEDSGIATREVGDITLYYSLDHYKMVPPDYQPTTEEQAAVEAETLFISYGADEIYETDLYSVSWSMDGVHYNLFGWDLDMDADDLFDMAEELINAGK